MTQLIDANLDTIHRFAEKEGIDYLGLFGSHSRGDAQANSDIDLLVRFKGRKSLLDMVRVERKLTQLIGRKVDLVTEKSISPYIRPYIQKDLQVIYGQG